MQVWIVNELSSAKLLVTAVLHHFCAPVTLQSQNIINVNKPIKMMADVKKKFPNTVPKALICLTEKVKFSRLNLQ